MNIAIYKIGFWSGLTAFGATVAYIIVQLLQVLHVLNFPLDEILIYGTSLAIVIPFVLEILAFHYITPDQKNSGVMQPSSFPSYMQYLLQPIMLFNWQR